MTLTTFQKQTILSNISSILNYKELCKLLNIRYHSLILKEIKKFLSENNINPNDFFSKRHSIMYTVGKDKLQDIFNNSSTYIEILTKLGYSSIGNNSSTLRRVMKYFNIDVTTFIKNNNFYNKNKSTNKSLNNISFDELILKTQSRSTIKKYILRNKLIQYSCSECGNIGTHQGKQLSLQLDHIDGNGANNVLSNLRLLCPNCHSQTNTFGSKNRTYTITHNINCKKYYSQSNIPPKIIKKNNSLKTLKFDIFKEELEKLVNEKSMTKIGEMFGVSDNAIRKRCLKLGINITNRKYSKG